MNASSDSVRPAKRHGLLFKLGIAFGIFVVLLVVLYFVVTSNAFFTGVILPKVSKAANAEITVSSASISPWSEVVLNNLKVVPNGREQLLQADLVRARYSLKDIIAGRIVVTDVTINSPVVTLVKNADGTSNLDPLTQNKQQPAAPKAPAAKPSAPPQLDISNVSLKNAHVEMVTNLKGGGREVAQITNFDLSIDQIRNGQLGKLNYSGDLAFDRTGTTTNQSPAGAMAAKLNGAFGFMTTPNLEPQSISGTSQVDVTKATGAMSNLAALGVTLDCDLTPTEVRKLNLRLEQSSAVLGELRVSGPFVLASQEGHLKVDLASVDQKALNMVGGPLGFDFNKTAIDSSNDIVLKDKGAVISVNGQFNANNLSVTEKAKSQTTPTLNLQLAYQLDVDQNKQSALIHKFDVNGTQNGKKFLQTSLSKPMPVSWGNNAGMPEEAALDLSITQLNLADWKSFAAALAPAGTLDTTLHIISREGGKNLALDLSTKLNDFSAKFGSNQIDHAEIELSTKLQVADFKKITLDNYHFQLARENVAAVTLDGSGTVNTGTNKDMNVKAVLDAQIPQLLNIVKVPGVNASSGTIHFDGQIAQARDAQTVTGNLALTSLSGNFAKYTLDRFQTKVDVDVAADANDIKINKANGSLEEAGLPGGSFSVSGTLNQKTKTGQFNLKLVDLNQNLLKPFVTPALGGKQLVQVSINADVNAKLEENSKSTLLGDFGFTNLVVKAAGQAAPAPLAAQFKIDGSFQQQRLDLRDFQIALSPTARGKNQIDFKGQVDLSQTNALKADLTVQADSIDVTPFYDIFSAKGTNATTTAQAQPKTAPSAAPVAAPVEPEAIQLPIQQVAVNLNIGQFYLHDIAITNWQTTVKIEGSHIVVNPFQLSLNGAPVKSTIDANVGVKGYTYDVTFSMDNVPVAPLADTFVPEKKGAFQGQIFANVQIKGAGVTGANLRKNLQGQANFGLTNATVQLQSLTDTKVFGVSMGSWISSLIQPISAALNISEVLSDPLNSAAGNLAFGQGKIGVQSMKLQSAAFIGDVHGDIPIADVLMDSPLNLPMTFSLAQPLVKKSPFLSGLAQANSAYVDLPELVKVGGTLGKPAAKVNLAGLAGKSGLSILKGIGNQVGGSQTKSIINDLGGILGGQTTPQNTATNAATNAPAKTQPAINNLLNNLFKK